MKRTTVIVLSLVGLVVVLCAGGLTLVLTSMPDSNKPKAANIAEAPEKVAGVPVTTPPPSTKAPAKLTKADIKLTVKDKTRECFGGVICNVEWKIKAAVDLDKLKASDSDWDVTYEVRGVQDGPTTGTLTFHPDGSFDQDEYASGQVKSSKTKLTATVTSVEQS